ncbi:hypothetical protein EAH78_08510 [Pseudomonas arsenicoxydans]|uniref:Phosphate starvation-inducible protein PsiF n=1 Tax=Pseudomonas arsenicoxydans TaxID=702115 RepID=A0A502HYK5_9PSED|nr:hypothetical protein EAH78_08510 [Pseudomonas arsenicoxydans]
MVSTKLTALIITGLLCVGSLSALAQSKGNDAPVDKGGVPPSTEMNASSADRAGKSGSFGGGGVDRLVKTDCPRMSEPKSRTGLFLR